MAAQKCRSGLRLLCLIAPVLIAGEAFMPDADTHMVCKASEGPEECLRPRGNIIGPLRHSCPLPMDDKHIDLDQPWTHRPYCVTSEDDATKKYCVYTKSDFGGHGISIVTSPETAADILNVMDDLRESAPAAYVEPKDPPYEVREVPGKGRGIVATRFIPRDEIFMVDHGALVSSSKFPENVKRVDGYKMLSRGASQLPYPERVLNLGRIVQFAPNVVEEVLRTNAFHSELTEEAHMVLFPFVSRINHGCKPNTFLRYSAHGLAVGVTAQRDIHPGEEITITYLPLGLTYSERQFRIQRWGFKCVCDFCQAPFEEVVESDKRRQRITDLKEEIQTALKSRKGMLTIKLTKELAKHLQDEGLTQMLVEPYETLAWMYSARKDFETAAMYANMTMDILDNFVYLNSTHSRRHTDMGEILDAHRITSSA